MLICIGDKLHSINNQGIRILAAPASIQTPLDRFYEHLAYKPWCGDDKAARLVRPKDSAITRPYIAPNSPTMVSWLVFDLDHSNSWIWEDKRLPEPNIIVSTPHTGRSHLYYAISPVCVSDNAHQKPIEYMKAVQRGMARALEADESYTGRIAKNPFCDHWKTIELHSYQYNLADLASIVEPISKALFTPKEEEDPRGRNCNLFLNLRYWAYAHVLKAKKETSFDDWLALVTKRAFSLSNIEIDFRENEIEAVAKSVAKWTWSHYTGSGVDRGAMELSNTDLPLQNKQRLSARRTHKVRTEGTEKRIRAAISQLTQGKAKVTKTAVAKLTGLSRQQITTRYSHLFNESQPEAAKQGGQAIKNPTVNFGVYQITAPFRGLDNFTFKEGDTSSEGRECDIEPINDS